MAIDKITKIDENFVLEGTHVVVPSGTTAQRPSGPTDGYVRFNSTIGSLEFYDETAAAWVQTNLIPNIDTLTGNINDSYDATLKFTSTNTTDNVTVVFRNSSNVELAEVTDLDSTTQPFYVDIPSAVTSAVSSGDTVKVIIQNSDGTPSSPVTKTVISAPTGGTINSYTEGGSAYRSHTFTSSSTFTSYESLNVDALLVAGGGGGAGGGGTGTEAGGGGGAGGMYTYTGVTFTSGTRNVTVGAGGAGRASGTTGNTGGDGGTSSVQNDSQVDAIGGGGAGQQNVNGNSGGSGGGGGGIDAGESSTSGGSGTSGQGTSGGNGTEGSGDMGAGGGGKSDAGSITNTASGGGGQGGEGASNTYKDGTTDYYAGGGGGGSNTTGTGNSDGSGNVGGQGGGGRGNTGTSGAGTAGTANTGGGGGGGYNGDGANGGSGIVVIRYKTDQVSV